MGLAAAGYAGYNIYQGINTYRETQSDEYKDKMKRLRAANQRYRMDGMLIDDQNGAGGSPRWMRDDLRAIRESASLGAFGRQDSPRTSTPTQAEGEQLSGWIKSNTKKRLPQYKRVAVRDENGAVVMDPYTFAPQYKKVKLNVPDPSTTYGKPIVNDYSDMQADYAKGQIEALAQAIIRAQEVAAEKTHDPNSNHHTMSMTLDLTGDKPIVKNVKSYISGWETTTSVKATDGRVVTDQ
jgi:hypothetical protein